LKRYANAVKGNADNVVAVVACTAMMMLTILALIPGAQASGESQDRFQIGVVASQHDPLVLTLSSPNAQSDGNFGGVAISGTTVVIGAPFETASGYGEAGHAYVFSGTTGALI